MKILTTKPASRRAWPLAGVAAAAALALAACGGGGRCRHACHAHSLRTDLQMEQRHTAATVTVSTLSLTGTGAPLVDPIGIVADAAAVFMLPKVVVAMHSKHINSAGVVTQLNAAVGDGILNLYGGNLYVAASADHPALHHGRGLHLCQQWRDPL